MQLRKSVTGLKAFPATSPLEDIAMDLLGPFLKTPRVNIQLLVVVEDTALSSALFHLEG